MDEEFMRYARYYGLGSVSDIVFNVPVELYKNPGSKIVITFYALRVDGFHGPEQLMMIKPGLIARLIKICIGAGWNPKEKGDFKVKLFASPVVGETSVLILSPKPNTGPNPEELVFELTEL